MAKAKTWLVKLGPPKGVKVELAVPDTIQAADMPAGQEPSRFERTAVRSYYVAAKTEDEAKAYAEAQEELAQEQAGMLAVAGALAQNPDLQQPEQDKLRADGRATRVPWKVLSAEPH